MMIIRDTDTSYETALDVLEKLSLPADNLTVLDGEQDPLHGADEAEERVLLLTSMPNGCLGYHKRFFDSHRSKIPLWVVLLLNEDAFVFNQAEARFHSDGIRRRLFTAGPRTDWARLSGDIKAVAQIRPFHVLLYSIRPHCGKKSLAALLAGSLPDWTFETAEENPETGRFPESAAGHIILVGQTLRDLYAVSAPESVTPLYVLTMPDAHIQAYLRREKLPGQLLKHLPPSMDWQEAEAQARFFYISPLYERWRREGATPSLDERFLIWDAFGLPFPRAAYTKERIHAFLA